MNIRELCENVAEISAVGLVAVSIAFAIVVYLLITGNLP